MIFIKAHQDFDFNRLNIPEEQYDEFTILSRNELHNDYPVNILYETEKNNKLNKWNKIYGDLTYQYYVYENIDKFDDIIGMMQYRRVFNNITMRHYKEIMKENDALLFGYNMSSTLVENYEWAHNNDLLMKSIDLIYTYKPEYRSIDYYNTTLLFAHNMFIMHKEDYVEYSKFMFWVCDMLQEKYNVLSLNEDPDYYRMLSLLGERLSTIFFLKHFLETKKKVYWDRLITL